MTVATVHVKALPVKPPKVTLLSHHRPFEWLLWKSLSDVPLTRLPETMDSSLHHSQNWYWPFFFFVLQSIVPWLDVVFFLASFTFRLAVILQRLLITADSAVLLGHSLL